jgi:hypothetical protein
MSWFVLRKLPTRVSLRRSHAPAYHGPVPTPPMDPLDRPVENALSLPDLEHLLEEASRGAGWTNADRYDLLDVWGSRTASIYRCRGRDTAPDVVAPDVVVPDVVVPDVVVKVGHGWSTADARLLDERQRALRSRLDPSIVQTPEPLGWTSDPAAVCTGYVEGTDLYFMLLDVRHPAWDSTPASATTVLARCGMALAHLHATPAAPPHDAERLVIERMQQVAHDLRLRPIATSHVDLKPVIGFGDVGPHQFRIGGEGDVWVLDPPMHPEPALPHQDIATFVFGIDRLLGARPGGRPRSLRATRADLREAFLDGYGRMGGIDPRTPADRWLIRLFGTKVAVGTARRRLRARELADAGRMLFRVVAGEAWLRSHRPPELRRHR